MMNSIFRKTLIATTLSAILSTAAIAADDYQETIDSDQRDESRLDSQQDNSLNDRSNTDLNNQQYQDTIDSDMTADNQVNGQQNKSSLNDRSSTDLSNQQYQDTIDSDMTADNQVNGQQNKSSLNDGKNPCYNDMEATASGKNRGMNKQDSENRPMTDHQNNVIEEEEEEEVMPRVGDDTITSDDAMPRFSDENSNDTDIDYSEESDMNIQLDENSTADNTLDNDMTSKTSSLVSMSPDDLVGMEVVDSFGEEVGYLSSIVLTPDQKNVHAVVTVGSIMGLGGRDILTSLNDLTLVNDELHLKANKDDIAGMNDYGSDDFIELEGDAAISTAIRP